MINNIFVYGPFTSHCCCTLDLLIATNQQRFTRGCPRLRYVGTRFRRGYARCTHEYTVGSRIFTDIRVFYTGFAEALRLLRYRRFSYGV